MDRCQLTVLASKLATEGQLIAVERAHAAARQKDAVVELAGALRVIGWDLDAPQEACS
jgi:hypothetical protein